MYILTAREAARLKKAGVVIQDESCATIPCQGKALCIAIWKQRLIDEWGEDTIGFARVVTYEAYIDGILAANLSVRLERYTGGVKWLAPLRRKYVIWHVMRILNV